MGHPLSRKQGKTESSGKFAVENPEKKKRKMQKATGMMLKTK